MFTDEPSPFKPRAQSAGPLAAFVLVIFAGLGAYTYVSRVTAHNEAAADLSRKLSKPAAGPANLSDPPSTIGQRQTNARVITRPEAIASRAEPSHRDSSSRTTIYFCKAYTGGTFWSDTTCSAQRATIDRMTTVSAALPFDRQVAIARGEAQEAALLYEPLQPVGAAATPFTAPARDRTAVCDVYDQHVRDLDAEARRPLPAFRQDQIRADRMNAMSARWRERC